MNGKEWKTGDHVKLATGGPKMAVVGTYDNYGTIMVLCQWFAKDELRQGSFPPENLMSDRD